MEMPDFSPVENRHDQGMHLRNVDNCPYKPQLEATGQAKNMIKPLIAWLAENINAARCNNLYQKKNKSA
jgi:hypothetical protein